MSETQNVSGAQRVKRKRFTTLEDHHMLTQYVALGYDSYSNKKDFWAKLYENFLECIGNNRNDRTQKAVENWFSRIRTDVQNFMKCYETATRQNPGVDPINRTLIAQSIYQDIYKVRFERDGEWQLLKDVLPKDDVTGNVVENEDMDEDTNPHSSQMPQNFSNMFTSVPSSSANPLSSQFVENQFTNNIPSGIPYSTGYSPTATPINIAGPSSAGFTGDKRTSKAGRRAQMNKNLAGKGNSSTPPSQDSQMSDAGTQLVDYLKESRTIVPARHLQQNQIMERLLETTQQQIEAQRMKDERDIMMLDLSRFSPTAQKYFQIQQNKILAKQMGTDLDNTQFPFDD